VPQENERQMGISTQKLCHICVVQFPGQSNVTTEKGILQEGVKYQQKG